MSTDSGKLNSTILLSFQSMGYLEVFYLEASDDEGFVQFTSFHDWPTTLMTKWHVILIPREACPVCWTDTCQVNMNFSWQTCHAFSVLPVNASGTNDLPLQRWIWRAENTIFDSRSSWRGQSRAQEHQETEWDAEPQSTDQGARRLGIVTVITGTPGLYNFLKFQSPF